MRHIQGILTWYLLTQWFKLPPGKADHDSLAGQFTFLLDSLQENITLNELTIHRSMLSKITFCLFFFF